MARPKKVIAAPELNGIQFDWPSWGYKMTEAGMVSELFEDGYLPPGYADTPAAFDEPANE